MVVDGQRYMQVSDYATYTGWARVGAHRAGYFRQPVENIVCAAVYPSTCGRPTWIPATIDFSPTPVTFWRWSGAQRTQGNVTRGQWVWVAPYAVGWSWVWTQQTGWLAARDSQLFVAN